MYSILICCWFFWIIGSVMCFCCFMFLLCWIRCGIILKMLFLFCCRMCLFN